MAIPPSRSLIFEVKSTGNELAFGRLRQTSANFGRLRKTSDFFGNLRKWSCRLQKSQHSQDKNLTLISQKKLVGIKKTRNISSLHLEHKHFAFHLYAPSSKVCESLHFFASCMLGEAVCKYVTLLVTQWLRENMLLWKRPLQLSVAIFQLLPLNNQDSKLWRIWRQTIIQRLVRETLTI